MEKFTKQIKGSISLFLSMIILLLVILEGFLIDGSKVLAGKALLSSAGDMALNAGLTYYDEALRDIYGLFATCETEEELTANLKIHFQKTLGETIGSEDPGYVDQLLGYIDTAIKSGWDGEEAGRLLDLTLDTGSFHAKGVGNSTLSESYVIKNQILEYMKYRGPASLGYGMIEKIYAFKDLNKQQKTVEAKLEYEETMSEIQEACEKAYSCIEPYNKLLEGDLKPEKVEEDSYFINRNMYEAVIATWCYSLAKRDPGIDKNWQKRGSDKGMDVPAAVRACTLMPQMSALYSQVASELKEGFDTHPSATAKAVKIILGYKEEYENYCRLYTTWRNYLDYYTKEMDRLQRELDALGDSEEDEDEADAIEEEMDRLREEKEEYEEKYLGCEAAINQFKDVLEPVRAMLEDDINKRMKNAAGRLNHVAKQAESLYQLGSRGSEALDDVLSAMDNLEQKGQTWQSAINNLSEGEVRTSMQSDLNNKSKTLDREKIYDLQEKLANGMSYAEVIKKAAKAAKAVDYTLYNAEKSSYYPYMKMKFESSAHNNETLPYNGVSFDDFSVATWVGNANHTTALDDNGVTVYFKGPNGGKTEGRIVKMDLSVYTSQMDSAISARNDEFFQYLERICPKSGEEEESEYESASKDAKDQLFEKGKDCSLSPGEELRTLSVDGSESGSPGFDKTSSDESDKKVSKKAKENTKSSSNFLSDVGSLLTKGRDKLYLSEYATQMFSYYTVDKPKNEDGSAPAVKETLSGYPMTAANNAMYKSEVEYILWGNPSGSADVQYTLTTIFGIRFLLNSIYAFTGDAEIRQISLALATSIAGWTGFGVPLVQSVIIIGFALAETAYDLEALKKGESVPIYKSSSTWIVKPSAFTKQALGQIVNDTASAAKSYIYEKMDELTKATADKFKKELGTFAEDTAENLANSAASAVLAPMQERLVGLVNVVTPDRNHIETSMRQALEDVKATISAEPDSIARTIKLEAVEYFGNRLIDTLITKVQAVQNNSGMTKDQITLEINGCIEECRSDLVGEVTRKAKDLVEKECDQVKAAMESANEDIQEKTSEAFDKMLMRIDCGISFADTSSVSVDGGKGRTGASAALTMNYKEYLWLFIAVKSIQNENEMLERIGTLIEANLARSETKPSPDFKIGSAYTFIEVDASADLSTTFFSMPVPVSGGGSVTLGQDKYSIGYRGVLGY